MELLNANNGMAPAWSPAGRTIAFLSNRESGWDLYRMDADGGTVVRLTSGRSPERPAWSTDGAWIVFERDRTIERIPARGGEARVVIAEAGWRSAPACRSIAPELAYARDGGIHLAALGGTLGDQVTSGGSDSTPSWSPAGDAIAFSRSGAIWLVDVASGREQRLTEGSEDEEPAWSPDGSRIVFVRAGALWLVDPEGGPPGPLISPIPGTPGLAGSPTWAPDGERIAVQAYQAGNWEIIVVRADADADGPQRLTEATWISSRVD